MDELERAGRAVRDAVGAKSEPSDRVRARARTIVRHRRMLAVGTIATAVIAASAGIGVAARGNGGLGVHTIAPAGSTTEPTDPKAALTTVKVNTTAEREIASVQATPLLSFADALHGWRVEPKLHQAIEHTVDGGHTWEVQLHRPSISNTVSGVVAVDDLDAFALVTNGIDWRSSGLMRTTDGSQWRRIAGTGLPGPLAFVSFVDSSQGWGVTYYGDLVATADGGGRWRTMVQPGTGELVGSVCLAAAGSGWAASGDSVYRSDDDGASWHRQARIPVSGGSTIRLVCRGPRAAYASWSVGAGQHLGAFIRTDDDGAHWRPYTEDLEAGATASTAPGFPENQMRGDPTAMTAGGTLAFMSGCYACGPTQSWVVVASPTDQFVVGRFDSTSSQQTLLLAAIAIDASHLFAEVQSFAPSGAGPRRDSLYASSDGGHTWQLRWSGSG